jgi:hypothetical protein
MKKMFILVCSIATTVMIQAQSVAPLWNDFVQAKKAGKIPVLPDFSWAGYHFSEKSIPDVAGRKQFNVKDYGAVRYTGCY